MMGVSDSLPANTIPGRAVGSPQGLSGTCHHAWQTSHDLPLGHPYPWSQSPGKERQAWGPLEKGVGTPTSSTWLPSQNSPG